jgi:anti-sigma B factor antagonist
MATLLKSKPNDLNVEIEELQGIVILNVSGTVDAHTYDQLEEKFQELFAEGKCRLVADMSGVQYISSAGIGVFVGALNQASGQGGNLILTRMSKGAQEVFDVLGIAPMFMVTAERDAAMAAFQ